MSIKASDTVSLSTVKDIGDTATEALSAAEEQHNYFWRDDAGVHVSTTAQEAASGNNVLIDSNGLVIRDGEKELASFRKDAVRIGEWSDGTQVGDKASLNFFDGTALMEFEACPGLEYGMLRVDATNLYLHGQLSAINLADGNMNLELKDYITTSGSGIWNPLEHNIFISDSDLGTNPVSVKSWLELMMPEYVAAYKKRDTYALINNATTEYTAPNDTGWNYQIFNTGRIHMWGIVSNTANCTQGANGAYRETANRYMQLPVNVKYIESLTFANAGESTFNCGAEWTGGAEWRSDTAKSQLAFRYTCGISKQSAAIKAAVDIWAVIA